ncbi:M48 family metallopeptidase [Microbulbifer sp. ALW1]|uniref:M48 family metallopeptidase n=1 Tax=Microbulbifer sp. (strain ALW1) TaxID=1516059 RepID=UPI001358D1B9|nr:M48 family metallopeptidase [Microbulbifer sp. ALW1]
MNFFEHQDKARRNTLLLIALFLSAVLGLITITTLFIAFISNFSQMQPLSPAALMTALDRETVAGVAVTIVAIITLASLYRLHQLAAGGRAVAESLGGRQINIAPRNQAERRALNVVEEMALASGTPVPDVYILDDPAINAFAAGYKPSDAVIGLTRGCIEQLSRDELQGVVAHEFSHIFNGDTRLNLRIVGLLHGILFIGLLGTWLLRGSAWGNRRKRGQPLLFGIGAGLILIGYTGTFFGTLIKSAMNRQREYLADASAVQFTRNHQGIAGALKKIGHHSQGASLTIANASEFSHMYFACAQQGVLRRVFSDLLATHPPLPDRILRLDPQWNGYYLSASQTPGHTLTSEPVERQMHRSQNIQMMGIAPAVPFEQLIDAVDNRIGSPDGQQMEYGRKLLASVPSPLHQAAQDPFAARALVYGLLIAAGTTDASAGNEKEVAHRQEQQLLLENIAHPAVVREFRQLQPVLTELPPHFRLPLLDLSIPALKALAPQQYQIFKRNVIKLIRANGELEIREWALYRVLVHALESNPDRQRIASDKHNHANALGDAQRFLLAAMAHTGSPDYLPAKRAYEAGMTALNLSITPLPTSSDITLQRLDKALMIACATAPLKKPALLKALATTLTHDNVIQAREIELLRALADCLDCPMPPLSTADDSSPQVPFTQPAANTC